jgi:hypothetical protein
MVDDHIRRQAAEIVNSVMGGEPRSSPDGSEPEAGGAAVNAGTAAKPRLLTAAAFVAGYVAPDYVIDGLLQRARVYSLTGDTGHGKTAVALCLAAHVAQGRNLGSRTVAPGHVVYLAAENPDDVQGRTILLADRMGINLAELDVAFIAGAFELPAWVEALKPDIEAMGGADLVIVDTSAAFLAASGAEEENDNLGMLRFAYSLRALTELPGRPAVLALSHPRKKATKDDLLPSGGGAFLCEIDGNLTIWTDGDRTTTELSWQGKFRGPTFEPIVFALECGTCPALADARGRLMPSVWARLADHRAAEASVERQRRDEDDVLLAIHRTPKLSLAAYAEVLGWRFATGEPAKSRVQNAVKRLEADKMVTRKRRDLALTADGRAEAERFVGGAS